MPDPLDGSVDHGCIEGKRRFGDAANEFYREGDEAKEQPYWLH